MPDAQWRAEWIQEALHLAILGEVQEVIRQVTFQTEKGDFKMRTKIDRRYRFVCPNCFAGVRAKWIKAHIDAGFALRHIACPECGQHCLRDRKAD